MAVNESRTCPECGAPLAVPQRRVGPLVVCPACRKSVSLKAAAGPPAGRKGGPRREARRVSEAPPRSESLVWIVQTADGRPAASMAKTELDRRVAAGEFDARTFVKRQDWNEGKSLAEVYQGLAESCSARQPVAPAAHDVPSSSLSHPASPWASVSERQTAEPAQPARPPDRLRPAKIFLLVGALVCGLAAFYGALGNSSLQPALPRRVLFLLFASYWLGAWLLAAALFDWRLESPEGELRGPHRLLGARRTRWLLAAGGVAIMAAVLWVVA